MKVRAEIHELIPREQLLRRIHRRLRPAVELSAISGEPIDLIAFPPDSRFVVSSKDVLSPIAKLGRPPANLVCVGYEFTQEARDCIHQYGGSAFSLDASFGWTDASWLSVHQTKVT